MATQSATLKPAPHKQATHTGLSDNYRAEMSESLSQILSHTYRLTIKSHLYHWNVVGPLFKPLHELTEEHYNALFAAADVIAERVRALGHLAPNDNNEVANFAPEPKSLKINSASDMIADLIAEHEAAVKSAREAASSAGDAGDVVTEDMLTQRLDFHEKALWMLRAIASN